MKAMTMLANDYQKLASRTMNAKLDPIEQIDHALFGMCSEVGEVLSQYQKVYQGHSLDLAHVKSELGDLLWFVSELCTVYGWQLSDVMSENIEKLRNRYPEGFDEERSINRKEGDI